MHSVSKRFFTDDNQYSQICKIPLSFMTNSNIKTNDVISINCGDNIYICQAFPLPVTELEHTILLDDTVSFSSTHKTITRIPQKRLIFPCDIKVAKLTTFEKVQVKLIFSDEHKVLVKNDDYCHIVFKLLRDYVFKKNATVKCEGRCLADLFHNIIISETFEDPDTFGRLSRSAQVEIIEVVSKDQLNQLKEFTGLDIGGIEEHKITLSSYLFKKASRKILILGPSGSGKSLFVKKFLSELKCCLIIIDGLKDTNISMNKCDMYIKRLSQSLKKFPDLPSILLVDHIHELASSNLKHQNRSSVSAVVYLLKALENIRVSIIVVSTERKNIHPEVSRFFEDEVFLGIPSFYQRKEMILALTRPFPNNNVDFDKVAAMTPGFLACDIAKLVQIASSDKKATFQEQNHAENRSLSTHHFETALLSITPTLLKTSEWNMKVKPVCWDDIGGMDGIKKRLQLCIERPLRHPELFQKVGLRCPRGVLLFGPPGCCKTTLARGLATECNANFFAANPSQIYSSYVGESEKNISQLFYQARLCAPSIIFLDELDSLVGRRTFETKQHGVAEKILSTLLNEMDGLGVKTTFGDHSSHTPLSTNVEEKHIIAKKQLQDEVIVVGATNRPDYIDDALLRPGRFDIILYVPPPNLEERVSILQTITKNMPLNKVDLRKIAERTKSFTGADLKNICSMAAMNSLKEHLLDAEAVSEQNFLQALEKAHPSVSKEQIQMYEKLSNKYGPMISNK